MKRRKFVLSKPLQKWNVTGLLQSLRSFAMTFDLRKASLRGANGAVAIQKFEGVKRFVAASMLSGCSLLVGEALFAAKIHKVGHEDTVYGIAYENGIPTRALISANNLKPPYALQPGQELTIPAPHEHIVGNGETLQNIAENYGVNLDVLARENGIQSPYLVSVSTHLMIPSRDTESFAEALKPRAPEEITASSLEPLPLVKIAPTPNRQQETLAPLPLVQPQQGKLPLPPELAEELALEKNQSSAAVAPAQQETKKSAPKKLANVEKKEKAKRAAFIWPVQGTVIGKFADGGKNDGINIKVPEGTPIKAAADGEVMYAGSELKSFGNLVLVKHPEGWVTAYAHNGSLSVKKGDKVKQGQTIAKSGKTGDVKEAQLHFELRKGKQPIDPLPKLGS